MAFNGCDTDGPHNKRLCTGQNSINSNDNNNNTNGSGLCSNGTVGVDVEMTKGLGLLRVNFQHRIMLSANRVPYKQRSSKTTLVLKKRNP